MQAPFQGNVDGGNFAAPMFMNEEEEPPQQQHQGPPPGHHHHPPPPQHQGPHQHPPNHPGCSSCGRPKMPPGMPPGMPPPPRPPPNKVAVVKKEDSMGKAFQIVMWVVIAVIAIIVIVAVYKYVTTCSVAACVVPQPISIKTPPALG